MFVGSALIPFLYPCMFVFRASYLLSQFDVSIFSQPTSSPSIFKNTH